MGRISDRFDALRGRGERALVGFLTAGDPDLETTEAIVLCMQEAGVDLIELGVPFSDPIAEGPTIQRASERALAAGTSLRRILSLVGRLRPKVDVPLLLMGYANPIHAMGPVPFAEAAAGVGVDGLITPDLPPEEGEPFYAECRARGILQVRIAHGKGIGAIRETVHRLLDRRDDVVRYRLDSESAGGWGATLVDLHPR